MSGKPSKRAAGTKRRQVRGARGPTTSCVYQCSGDCMVALHAHTRCLHVALVRVTHWGWRQCSCASVQLPSCGNHPCRRSLLPCLCCPPSAACA